MIEREIIVTENDGTRRTFNNVKEAAEFYGMGVGAVRNRARGTIKSEKRKFEYGKRRNNSKTPTVKTKGGKPWNESGYEEIPYETIGTRVCVTECTKNKAIKVGSVMCKACFNHRGQNRELHLVACGIKK